MEKKGVLFLVTVAEGGGSGWTPLHHAAEDGHKDIVKLQLSLGANALQMNDDGKTPLDTARAKDFSNIVRAIERRVCLFSGWLRMFNDVCLFFGWLRMFNERGSPDPEVPIGWVVVLPSASTNRLEVAIYSDWEVAKPHRVIASWTCTFPKNKKTDPRVVIFDHETETRSMFAPGEKGDKEQFQRFCNACKGIPESLEDLSESLHEQVKIGDIKGIKGLKNKGAHLEWMDINCQTALILACRESRLHNVAKTLIELGADVNGIGGGGCTPLHHAAEEGLKDTVRLLLSHGANALQMNDDGKTPLDIAREEEFIHVVDAIERHICLFSGQMQIFNEPGTELLIGWVVVLPSASTNRLEVALYSNSKAAKPHRVIASWTCTFPKNKKTDPRVVIFDHETETRSMFAPGDEGDKEQFQQFCNACKGIPESLEDLSESLHEQVKIGDIKGIKGLKNKGAHLEWMDINCQTALILACRESRLHNVAKTLIELGADVNDIGGGGCTPLHHAAEEGLKDTVRLLLSHGANALQMNDDGKTPLDIAREEEFIHVVDAIERHICLFSGQMQIFNEPGTELLIGWVVVLPSASTNRLEVALYSNSKAAKPHRVIASWTCTFPKNKKTDPRVVIFDHETETRSMFAPGDEGDKEQFQQFCNACKGIPESLEDLSESLHEQVKIGDIKGIKGLKNKGAHLEWMDINCQTALILACRESRLHNVAKTLIELGADVNGIGGGGWTPLHHAAEVGLADTVELLLSHGANALQMNDDGKTPLDIAREEEFIYVVRAIQGHICLFSGQMRIFNEPGTELLRGCVVVLPSASTNRLEVALYSNSKVAKPHRVIALWRANLEEPKNNKPDPSVKIFDNTTKSSIIFAPEKRGDKEQLERFYNACKGNPQAIRPAFPHNNSRTPVVQPTAPPEKELEDFELKKAKWVSLQSDMAEVATCEEANASSSSVDRSSPPVENLHDRTGGRKEDGGSSSSCVICWDAPVEGACVPCGHMAGCMSCLEEIKAKKGDCPVCRAKVNQVIKIFAV